MLFSHLPRLAGLAVLVYAVIWVLILPPVEELQDAVEEEPLVTELAPEIRITEEDFLVDAIELTRGDLELAALSVAGHQQLQAAPRQARDEAGLGLADLEGQVEGNPHGLAVASVEERGQGR